MLRKQTFMKAYFQLAIAIFICFTSTHTIAQTITTFAGVYNLPDCPAVYGFPISSYLFDWPKGIVTDNLQNIYFSDIGCDHIYKIDAGGILHNYAGNGTVGYTGDGGPATAAEVSQPIFIAAALGNVYVSDYGNNAIRKIDASGNMFLVAGNYTSHGFSGDGGPATNALLAFPQGIAVDNTGNIYFVDQNSIVRKINTSGIITTIAGTLYSHSYSGDGGPASAATFNDPAGICLNHAGDHLYIADADNNCVRVIDLTTGIIDRYAGNAIGPAGWGAVTFSGDGGPATLAQLNYPHDVTMDIDGNLYIADYYFNRVRKVSSSGTISTYVGNGLLYPGWTGDGGPATAAGLLGPENVNVDCAGRLFIDYDWHNIRMVNGISGSLGVGGEVNECIGQTTTLTGALTGGTWSSAATSIATVGSTTGIVTGISSGATTITYTITSTGCAAIVPVTINAAPAITGPTDICIGTPVTLTGTPAGGIWVSGTTSVATVGSSSGVVTGVSAGTATITYTSGCPGTYPITVNALPAAITGSSSVCVGATVALTDATLGGTWSSSDPSAATVGSSTGIVTGIAAGTLTITYTTGACFVTYPMTVNALPAAISGPMAVCIGSSITLTDATSGGAWSTSDPTVATVGTSTGIVTGVAAGTVTIDYTSLTTGC